jgi:TonB family protein
MQSWHHLALAVTVLACFAATGCVAQGFPSGTDAAQSPPKPKQQDAGFPSAPTATSTTTHAPQQSTDFVPPETVQPQARTEAVASVALGTNSLMATAHSRFAKAHALMDMRVAGATPFRMHAVFSAVGNEELTNGGTYSEVWTSPTQWRREATVGNVQVVEARDGDKFYRKIVGGDYVPRQMDDLLDELGRSLPALDDTFAEADWQQGIVMYGGSSVLRITQGFDTAPPGPEARAFWMEEDGKLRASYAEGVTIEYTDYEDWSSKQVARHVDLKENGVKVAGFWIDQLAAIPAETGTQFAIDGVAPIPLNEEAEYTGPYFVPPHPVRQVSPKDPPAGEGTIVIDVHLDHHGHVRSARMRQGLGPALDDAAMKAAMQWEFAPALRRGRPVASEAVVQFTF